MLSSQQKKDWKFDLFLEFGLSERLVWLGRPRVTKDFGQKSSIKIGLGQSIDYREILQQFHRLND